MRVLLSGMIACAALAASAQQPPSGPSGTANFGPYNATFLEGGVGLSRPLAPDRPLLAADAPWSISTWVRAERQQPGRTTLVALGDAGTETCRCLELQDGRPALALAGTVSLASRTVLEPGKWHALAVTHDGTTARLFVDGNEIASRQVRTAAVSPVLHLAPDNLAARNQEHFGGTLAGLQLHASALPAKAVQQLAAVPPDPATTVFHRVGAGWPWQLKAWRGLQEPQDPWTLPRGKTPPSPAIAAPVPQRLELRESGPRTWTLEAWTLIEASKTSANGAQLSQPEFSDSQWYVATVPGTVLTTLIDRGVYPDPDYGLNNLAIPEGLARQDYWYRSSFAVPAELAGSDLTLTFKGINFAAEVWLNGARLGNIRGAFIRGVFDVSQRLQPGTRNALAVRISPPPHPGIPHEESIAAGPGENGGNLAIDGPTFVASEGWDWIPGIRDRNSGIWQPVELKASGKLHLLDPQIVTRLPLPRSDEAEISVLVPVENRHPAARDATIAAGFEGVRVEKRVTLPPGKSEVRLEPREFPQLRLRQPRLWWPNGYGPANLYTLSLSVADQGSPSDARSLRFGVRHITYELSLFDRGGRLRRVEIDPAPGSTRGERLIDVSHEAIKKSPRGWAASLTPAGESSPAVKPVATESLTPHLAIRVNGVPIAARGGNWGTDDSRKRISRERLEPYFRLHREANLNTIRNWVGQNTEDVFYELADEYGLLILNDFWASTQDFQVEPQDPALFLANARDVILRYRNHPSIALWFGRNEGVPQPILNEGLADLVAELDGTRYFNGSSNNVNLQGSGPYNYRPPSQYFTDLALGFSVEVGTLSLSTLEAIEASVPPADRWPISDTLAYHDWHHGGNGDVATFMKSLDTQFGAATSLEDFERKAQMMNYVTYRAMFEGFHAGLWTRNSGRLLWMTHPAWPSNAWQIYSSDYDTHAAYYGVKKASEPVHAQMDLPDYRLAVINTTRDARPRLKLRSRVISLEGRTLAERSDQLDAAANQVTPLAPLDLQKHLDQQQMVIVALALTDSSGAVLSENIYWQGRDEASHRRLNTLAGQPVTVSTRQEKDVVHVELVNRGNAPALNTKLTLVDAKGQRILPAYYSDNYLTLLPGEPRRLRIHHSGNDARVRVRGWNVQ
jgi:hypothetical protein